MSNQLTGLAIQGAQLGLQSILFKPPRKIATFAAQVTLEETHVDELEITSHPVEQGARISDHAYLRPAELTIRAGWSNSPQSSSFLQGLAGAATQTVAGVNDIISGTGLDQTLNVYRKLLELQTSRLPFSVVTGKRTYDNMLFKSLRVETNKETENSLLVTAVLRQLIIVKTQVISSSTPAENQATPALTQAPTELGQKQLQPAPNSNLGDIETTIEPGGTTP